MEPPFSSLSSKIIRSHLGIAATGDNMLADAILDRLMHNAHRLPMKGESMRKILGQLTEDEHLG